MMMAKEIGRSYIFSLTELEILLKKIGCTKIFGLFEECEKVNQRETYEALASMVSKEFIIRSGDQFLINRQIRNALISVKNAERIIYIQQRYDMDIEYVCYVENKYVTVFCNSPLRKDALTMMHMEKYEFFNDMICSEFPEEEPVIADILSQADCKVTPILREILNGKIPEQLKFMCRIYTSDGIVLNNFYVIDCLIALCSVSGQDENLKYDNYNKDQMKTFIERILFNI